MGMDLKMIKEVDAGKSFVRLYENNLIENFVKDNVELDLPFFLRVQEIKRELAENKPHVVLFVAPEKAVITKEAREFAASSDASINALAKAILVPNLEMKLISDFFVNANNPTVPHKIFNKRDEAIEWLFTFF